MKVIACFRNVVGVHLLYFSAAPIGLRPYHEKHLPKHDFMAQFPCYTPVHVLRPAIVPRYKNRTRQGNFVCTVEIRNHISFKTTFKIKWKNNAHFVGGQNVRQCDVVGSSFPQLVKVLL